MKVCVLQPHYSFCAEDAKKCCYDMLSRVLRR